MSGVAQQTAGFDGEVSGMSLTDLLQIKVMGRFSGRIVVEQNGKSGHLFFREGDLVHAQLDQFEGKDAFARVLAWDGGTFRAEPKVGTTRQTINESFQFLLLDALRLQDEIAAGLEQQRPAAETAQSPKGGGMKDRLSGIAGLQDVALTDRSGMVVQSIGSNAESLAAQGMYLVSTSSQIGDELGLGSFKGAVVQGVSGHIVSLEGAKNYLFVGVQGEAKPSAVEAEVRRALANQG
jgi:predicted regulator of Ras-like GTPase activity (Roadblock/LC7/MglB family)